MANGEKPDDDDDQLPKPGGADLTDTKNAPPVVPAHLSREAPAMRKLTQMPRVHLADALSARADGSVKIDKVASGLLTTAPEVAAPAAAVLKSVRGVFPLGDIPSPLDPAADGEVVRETFNAREQAALMGIANRIIAQSKSSPPSTTQILALIDEDQALNGLRELPPFHIASIARQIMNAVILPIWNQYVGRRARTKYPLEIKTIPKHQFPALALSTPHREGRFSSAHITLSDLGHGIKAELFAYRNLDQFFKPDSSMAPLVGATLFEPFHEHSGADGRSATKLEIPAHGLLPPVPGAASTEPPPIAAPGIISAAQETPISLIPAMDFVLTFNRPFAKQVAAAGAGSGFSGLYVTNASGKKVVGAARHSALKGAVERIEKDAALGVPESKDAANPNALQDMNPPPDLELALLSETFVGYLTGRVKGAEALQTGTQNNLVTTFPSWAKGYEIIKKDALLMLLWTNWLRGTLQRQ